MKNLLVKISELVLAEYFIKRKGIIKHIIEIEEKIDILVKISLICLDDLENNIVCRKFNEKLKKLLEYYKKSKRSKKFKRILELSKIFLSNKQDLMIEFDGNKIVDAILLH